MLANRINTAHAPEKIMFNYIDTIQLLLQIASEQTKKTGKCEKSTKILKYVYIIPYTAESERNKLIICVEVFNLTVVLT